MDYIVIGAGPAGITIAFLLAKNNYKVLLLDREDNIGGCHRVRRVYDSPSNSYLFSEHGPRIYSSSYKSLHLILKEMGSSFYDFFTPYKYGVFDISSRIILEVLKPRETILLSVEVLKLLIYNKHGQDTTVYEFMERNRFSKKTKDYIDSICRLTDGADSKRYTLFEFLSLVNQQIFYRVYQPNAPLDMKFFPFIEQKLIEMGVSIVKGCNIESITKKDDKIVSVKCNNKVYNSKNFIFAIPPESLSKLLMQSTHTIDIFGSDFHEYAKKTEYMHYIPIVFHFDKQVALPNIHGFPSSEWGITFIVLTDYMKMNEEESKMVISTIITKTDSLSKITSKNAHMSSKGEMIDEVYSHLKKTFPNIPMYYRAIVSPGVYKKQDKWVDVDTSFYKTKNTKNIPYQSPTCSNAYTLGTHNGNSQYNFTSMESAMSNAINLFNTMTNKPQYKIDRIIELRDVLVVLIVLVILYALYQIKNK
jgi:hypothetical protein